MAEVVAAERIARAVVLAFGACEDTGVPLSEAQKIAVIEAALLEFDGFDADLGLVASVREVLHDCRG